MFARFRQWRTGRVQKLVAGAVSMAPGALTGCCKGIDRCARYPVSFDLSAEEVKTEPTSIHFVPRKLGNRPPTRELVALFVPLTTAVAVAVDTQRGGGGPKPPRCFSYGNEYGT